MRSRLGAAIRRTVQGGAASEQVQLLGKAASYAACVAEEEWTCGWRIPLGDLGWRPAATKVLLFNLGARSIAEDNWIAWVPTGGPIYQVDSAGELHLER